jgi:hypothetical protein
MSNGSVYTLTYSVFIVKMGWDCVHPPDNTWVNMKQRLNDTDRGKPKDSERNLFRYHFVLHKFLMNWPGRKSGPKRWEAGDEQHELWHGHTKV